MPRSDYDDIADQLDAFRHDQDGPEFRNALQQLVKVVDDGDVEAAEFLAEILAQPGSHYDPSAAYKWYFIALSQQGFSVDLQDWSGSPSPYCGPIGDFRNESMVNELLYELGPDRVAQLDSEAREWLRIRGRSPS